MNGNWREAEDRFVNLPEREPKIFALWLNHAYTNQIPTKNAEVLENLRRKKIKAMIRQEYTDLCELYVLCEELVDRSAQHAIFDALFAIANIEHDGRSYGPVATDVAIVYEGTLESSPMRKLMVDFWSNVPLSALASESVHIQEVLPKEFCFDLICALRADRDDAKGNTALDNGPLRYREMLRK
jgi:hypothetical protein